MRMAPNTYSKRWFEFFHDQIPEARTALETRFIRDWLPLPAFGRVLDVCCGSGRHACALANFGYDVVGVDRDADILAKARAAGAAVTYISCDVREFQPQSNTFDAAIIMSQSFGYYDAETNHELLRCLTSSLRPGGRIIIDAWNPEFFRTHEGERELKTTAGSVRESKHMQGNRLFVRLGYPDGGEDSFEWQLFTPEEMTAVAAAAGLHLVVACTDFDARTPVQAARPRIQFVLERSN
jgi:SAM-dependent methyltransferase